MAEVVLDELTRALKEKIGLDDERIGRVLELLEPFRCEVEADPPPAPLELRDASDAAIVHAAVSCGADVLVTGDKDLLEAEVPVEVRSPRSLWEALRVGGRGGEIHER